MSLQFADVAAAALEMAPVLLAQWIGGKRQGHEWVGERKANGGLGDSWAVNLNTGQWLHGAGDEVGGDLVSLHAAIYHLEQIASLKQVAALVGVTDRLTAPILPRTAPPKAPETKPEPIPADAPPIPVHPQHGTASAVYVYGTAFVVARYDLAANEKQFRPFTWRGGKWHAKGYPEPRPLYGAARLAEMPEAPVLIVEGEKCADIAAHTMRRYVVLTWAGGAQAVKKSDWAPLAGRDVIIWPDADEPGAQAAATIAERLSGHAERVRVIQPNGQTDGWDIADAVAEGWDAKAIAKWAGEHIRVVTATMPEPTPAAAAHLTAEPSDFGPEGSGLATAEPVSTPTLYADDGASPGVRWSELNLETNQGGLPFPTLANASQILQIHPMLKGKIWFDTFQQKIWHSLKGVKKEWTDANTADLTVFIQQSLKLNKFNLGLVSEAIGHAARINSQNSLTDYLSGLQWDGTARLDEWLSDSLGVERSPYSIAVANNWPISMVARAFNPGTQADHMPVLEGKMGRGKSSFLSILGGEWYDAITTAIGDKDFVQALQGVWLVEIPDMAGFGRREHSLIISTITIRKDRYRASYGRYVEDHQRGCILSATSETDDYLAVGNGRRRFWPLRCQSIDLDVLHAQRDQIFAEAVMKYRAGEKWFQMPEGTEDEQTARIEPDLWAERALNYAAHLIESFGASTQQITSELILKEAIEMPMKDQGQKEKNRIAQIMRTEGWVQLRNASKRYWKKIERLP
jgi:putative DNA primase/helicase